MNITIITPPPFEPVTLLQVYGQLRLSPDEVGSPAELSHPDDQTLLGNIATARAEVEALARRSLVQQTLRLSLPDFPRPASASLPGLPAGALGSRAVKAIRLIRPPVLRVESVSYFDADNTLQDVDAASYYVTDEVVPELRFTTGFAPPVVYDRPDAVRVNYVAGYTPVGSPPATQADFAANVPQSLKDAILVGVQLLYDNMAPADAENTRKLRAALVQPLKVHLEP